MCGIVGYIGKPAPLAVLTDSLKRLEYRGYDSAGIAFLNGAGVEVIKTRGRLHDLEELLPRPLPIVTAGLGHTRWATHGAPSTTNAHPHRVGPVAVVHNGIIENYSELRSALEAEGAAFASQTDTEVVPHLLAKHLRAGRTLCDAVRAAAAALRGSFALGILSEDEPGALFALRRGSPLVVGLGDGAYYFASDIPALLPYTRKYVYLDDGQLCELTANGVAISDCVSRAAVPVAKRSVTVDWTPAMAEKEGHAHFMHKEIFEQPAALQNTAGEWRSDMSGLLRAAGLETGLPQRLHIVACGTSYHAAMVAKYTMERLAQVPVTVDIASEYRYRTPVAEPGTLFVSITQSGETADTLAAQREAARRGAQTLTVCNVVGSTAPREADAVLYTRSGPEIGVASTKTFTAQLAALFLLALGLGIERGTISKRDAQELLDGLDAVPELMRSQFSQDLLIRDLASTVKDCRTCLFLGRGVLFPLALEGALKMKEISYIHAEGYAAGEMKHGPIALIDRDVPVFVLAFEQVLFEKTLSNIEEVRARGGRLIVITDAPRLIEGKADRIIEAPKAHPFLSPFLAAVPLQLLAYHAGVLRGCDVDKPRNLAKSVTVE